MQGSYKDGRNEHILHSFYPTVEPGFKIVETYLKKALVDPKFNLRANNNTLQCELYCSYEFDFGSRQHGIGAMLGFMKTTKLEPSDTPVNLNKLNVLEVRCSAVHGSYKDGRNEHILHSFYPTVEPGFKIVKTPSTVIYLSLIHI